MTTDPTFWLSRDEVRELDRRAIEGYGVPGIVLMENAGRGCAELLMRLNPDRKPTVILCGPGNNGGDGFVIARHLDNHGWPVRVWLFEPERLPAAKEGTGSIRIGFTSEALPPDARTNCEIVRRSGIDFVPIYGDMLCGTQNGLSDVVIKSAVWVVDALFGTGLTRPLGSPYSELVAQVNASGNPVLAVDIPSGLDCDTGEPLGPTVRATHTATFVAHKKGFLNPRSRDWTGEVHVIDIGAPRKLVDEYRRPRSVT
jgi:NAD(P)H-hydrate epimerase